MPVPYVPTVHPHYPPGPADHYAPDLPHPDGEGSALHQTSAFPGSSHLTPRKRRGPGSPGPDDPENLNRVGGLRPDQKPTLLTQDHPPPHRIQRPEALHMGLPPKYPRCLSMVADEPFVTLVSHNLLKTETSGLIHSALNPPEPQLLAFD